MIPYGTLSLVGIHAYWIAPVFLRASAPIARQSLRRSLNRMRKAVPFKSARHKRCCARPRLCAGTPQRSVRT